MNPFIIRHLIESTLFCMLLSSLACCLRGRATVRHTVWLVGIAKFAIPSVLLSEGGARMAFLWPATAWITAAVQRVLSTLALFLGMLPASLERGHGACRNMLLVWFIGTAAMFAAWIMRLRTSNMPSTLPTVEEREIMRHAPCSMLTSGTFF